VADVVATSPPSTSRVVTSYYALSGLYTLSAALIWGVNTLFLLSAGLDFLDVFIANAAFSAGMVIFEVPTGVVADTLGRRTSFLLSVSVLAVTTLAYVGLARVGAGVVAFSVVSVAMGLGFTFYSGATEAWLVDALAVTGFAGPLDRVLARGQQITGAAMLVGTVGGGLLGQVDLSVPYVVRAALLLVVFAVAFVSMFDLGFTPRRISPRELPREVAANARAGVEFGWSRRPLRLLMLAAVVQTGFFTWGFYASQPYLLGLLGRDEIWVSGLVAAGVALSMIAGNQIVHASSRYCGRRTTLLLAAAGVETCAAVALGLASSFWVALVSLLVVTASVGVTSPVRSAYLHQVVPTEKRATVVSFDSMVSSAGGIVGQVGLGVVGQARSVGAAFTVGGLATAAAFPFLLRLRRLGGPADRIVGARGGVEAACAADGLPPVSVVGGPHLDEKPVATASGG